MPKRSLTFASVYEDHVWDVYGFFGYRVASREAAEDLTQGTFERALGAWDRYDDRRATPRTWLLAIARNLLIDHYRQDRSALHDSVEAREGQAALGVVPSPEAKFELDGELALALAELNDRERELIALRFGGDLSGPEIAEMTGLTLANVQQIFSRALRRLREELAEREQTRT